MIPKIIHYCWFGRSPLPIGAKRCIDSWKKFLPDYTILEWNEDNFDVHAIPYVFEAYQSKKYAFVSDYARFWILYHYGGIYFDTDVEVIHPMDDIIEKGGFMGCEITPTEDNPAIRVNAGLGLGVEVHHPLYAEIIQYYADKHFILANRKQDLTTVVEIVTKILLVHQLKLTSGIQTIENITIYPKEYFCPVNYDGTIHITTNTRTIHHYDQSWRSPIHKLGRKIIIKIGGYCLRERVAKIYNRFAL